MKIPSFPVPHNIAFLSFLYFFQGLPSGLQTRFLPVYFRTHGMSLSNVGYFRLLFFPWMLKALWAPLVDHFGTKKTWLTWSMLGIAATCFIGSFSSPDHLTELSAILFFFNLLTSTQDIAVDALAIQILTSSQLSHGNIAQVVAYKFGSLCSGGLLTWLSEYFTWTILFQLLSLMYLTAVAIAAFFIPTPARNEITVIYSDPQTNSTSSQNPSDSVDDDADVTSLKEEQFDDRASFSRDAVADGSGLRWLRNHFSLIMRPEGTSWTICYVLVYKLGEQGALSMIPLYLVDRNMPASVVVFWTGVVGLVVSISGSFLGGWAIPVYKWPPVKMLRTVSMARTAVLFVIFMVVTIATTSEQTNFKSLCNYSTTASMLVLLLFSGITTTMTCTLMMQCSRRAALSVQASHYSTLATMEVVGKLTFSVMIGMIADYMGYPFVFLLCTMLTAGVIPLFSFAPPVLWNETITNKNS